MADQEHLNKIRGSIAEWNTWRREHPKIHPNFSSADLSNINLSDANLSYIHFVHANLSGTDLSHADLRHANLLRAVLRDANLSDANLSNASLACVDLSNTDLSSANLSDADLSGANLRNADLSYASLIDADLSSANFDYVTMSYTQLGDRDFREIKGLETIGHRGPSSLSINSLYLSEGHIPEAFVRGTGAPEGFIEYMRALTAKPIEYYTCFISYSSKNQEFAERLYTDLQANNVRCWFAPEEMKIGDTIRQRIDDSIHIYDKLLVILSADSICSQWVENEVETAFEKEQRYNKSVLFPVRIDNTIMDALGAWAANIRRTRHIGDFTNWKDYDAYQRGLKRLLRDLKADN